MCMFTQQTGSVHGTKIFARRTAKGTQFIAYQMHYIFDGPNAMILPLPVRLPSHEGTLRFIDLSHYPSFFRDLAEGYPNALRRAAQYKAEPTLPVVEVGSFVASFVPSLEDFARLDPQFVLPPAIWDQLPQYADFGFAVFRLKPGDRENHAMAFEFQSRTEELFFPTVHIHDLQVHETAHFGHMLYMQHAGFDSVVGHYDVEERSDRETGLVRSTTVASELATPQQSRGLLQPDLLIHRTTAVGRLPNQDITIGAKGDPEVPTRRPSLYRGPLGFSLWTWVTLPSSLAGAFFAWVLWRRHRRKAGQASKS